MHDHVKAKGIEASCFANAEDYGLDETIAHAGLEAFDEAMALADDEVVRARVEKASICAYRLAVEDAWRWTEQHEQELDDETIPSDIAERTRPHLKRLFELCERYGVTNWHEWNPLDRQHDLLRRAFSLDEGDNF